MKDTFLAAISDYKQIKAETISPSSHPREQLKNLRKIVKHMLWNSRDEFLGSAESDPNTNPKCFWSILKLNSKSHAGNRTPLRSSAKNPREIANQFNSYFTSVFAHDTPSPLFIWKRCQCTNFS